MAPSTTPFSNSLDNKLQTLAIVALLLTQIGSLVIIIVFCYYIIFHTTYWWLCLLYIIWTLTADKDTPETDGRRSEWVRSWIWWVYVKNYFPIKMVKLSSTQLDPKKNYLFAYFPHGILSVGAFITMATNSLNINEYFPNHITSLHTISLFFQLPFLRELGLWFGGRPATAKALHHNLSKPKGGNISALVLGGASEAYYCKPGLYKVVYKKRKGFIKIAFKNGSPLVPVYCFGETNTYTQNETNENSLFFKFSQFMKKLLRVTLIRPIGTGLFGILPHRTPITVVVGEPIEIGKIEHPSQEQIDEIHQKFEEKLIELFESQKKNYLEDHEDAHLEIC